MHDRCVCGWLPVNLWTFVSPRGRVGQKGRSFDDLVWFRSPNTKRSHGSSRHRTIVFVTNSFAHERMSLRLMFVCFSALKTMPSTTSVSTGKFRKAHCRMRTVVCYRTRMRKMHKVRPKMRFLGESVQDALSLDCGEIIEIRCDLCMGIGFLLAHPRR